MPKSGIASSIPLHAAIGRGDFTAASKLVTEGADVNAKDPNGNTSLHLLLQSKLSRKKAGVAMSDHDRLKLLELLLEHGAEIKSQDKDGYTALHLAAKHDHVHIIEVLLRHGAPVDEPSKCDHTALYLAAGDSHIGVVKLLLKNGAEINRRGERGNTALHLAAKKGHWGVVNRLLEHGADVSVSNADGHTVLQVAIMFRSGHWKLVGLLIHEHLLRNPDVKAILSLISEISPHNTEFNKLYEGFVQKHHLSSDTRIQFIGQCGKVQHLRVQDLLDRSKQDALMIDGARSEVVSVDLEKITHLDHIKDGCVYCVETLEELLRRVKERAHDIGRLTKEFGAYRQSFNMCQAKFFNAYQVQDKDQPLTMIPWEILEKILTYLPQRKDIQAFTGAFRECSPQNDAHIGGAVRLRDLDADTPSAKRLKL